MERSYRPQVRAWLVLLVAIGALLGHVCALPLYAHADEAASATPRHGGPGETDEHAVHCPSCEALRTTPAELGPMAVTSSTAAQELLPLARDITRGAAPVVHAESPPLFLLHAVLLI